MTATRWMLCLDTSAPRTCVALGRVAPDPAQGQGEDELLVTDERQDRANQTSASLDARLRELLARAGVAAGELGLVACGRGPGTFTGSRVAVATAKGLALGLGLPVVPVSTLAALAASASPEQTGARVLALLDARRGQVYAGIYELGGALVRVGEERVIELASFLRGLERVDELTPYGPGCGPYAEQLPPALRARSELSPGPTAAGLWRAALSALRAGEAGDPGALSVAYLRESYAEMGINKPKRPRHRADPALYE